MLVEINDSYKTILEDAYKTNDYGDLDKDLVDFKDKKFIDAEILINIIEDLVYRIDTLEEELDMAHSEKWESEE